MRAALNCAAPCHYTTGVIAMRNHEMIQLALSEGFSAAALIDVKDIVIDPMFRPFCEENLCGHYGANYTCPPDCGTVSEMEDRLRAYPRALVFQTRWPITDYTDHQAIKAAKCFHNNAMLKVIEVLKANGLNGLMCGASCCTLCEKCALEDHLPCRFPDIKWSCLSAYCIFVRKLAESCQMEYSCEDGSLAFFGLYAFDEQ